MQIVPSVALLMKIRCLFAWRPVVFLCHFVFTDQVVLPSRSAISAFGVFFDLPISGFVLLVFVSGCSLLAL